MSSFKDTHNGDSGTRSYLEAGQPCGVNRVCPIIAKNTIALTACHVKIFSCPCYCSAPYSLHLFCVCLMNGDIICVFYCMRLPLVFISIDISNLVLEFVVSGFEGTSMSILQGSSILADVFVISSYFHLQRPNFPERQELNLNYG